MDIRSSTQFVLVSPRFEARTQRWYCHVEDTGDREINKLPVVSSRPLNYFAIVWTFARKVRNSNFRYDSLRKIYYTNPTECFFLLFNLYFIICPAGRLVNFSSLTVQNVITEYVERWFWEASYIRLSGKCLSFTTTHLYTKMKHNLSNVMIFILIEQNGSYVIR